MKADNDERYGPGNWPKHDEAAVSPKPCPFCGLWPTVRQAETGRWVAMCSWSNKPREERKGVRHHVDFFAETKAEAIDGWNARP